MAMTFLLQIALLQVSLALQHPFPNQSGKYGNHKQLLTHCKFIPRAFSIHAQIYLSSPRKICKCVIFPSCTIIISSPTQRCINTLMFVISCFMASSSIFPECQLTASNSVVPELFAQSNISPRMLAVHQRELYK